MYLGIFQGIIALKKYHGSDQILRPPAQEMSTFTTGLQELLFPKNMKGKTMSADNLPDKSRNFSSQIMECGSSEKFEATFGKCQLILWRTFFRNICCNIFMKQLKNIRGRRNIPPAFTTVNAIFTSSPYCCLGVHTVFCSQDISAHNMIFYCSDVFLQCHNFIDLKGVSHEILL